MRLAIDTLVVLMLIGVAAFVFMHGRAQSVQTDLVDATRDSVRRFNREILLQAALEEVEQVGRGYPATIDPTWFEGQLPINTLVGSGHPWVEVAGPEASHLDHPPNLIAGDSAVATFWYNPWTGVIRARIPAMASDREAIKAYNDINGVQLDGLFAGVQTD